MAADPATRTRLGDPQAWGWMDVSRALDRMAMALDGMALAKARSTFRSRDAADGDRDRWREHLLYLASVCLWNSGTNQSGGGGPDAEQILRWPSTRSTSPSLCCIPCWREHLMELPPSTITCRSRCKSRSICRSRDEGDGGDGDGDEYGDESVGVRGSRNPHRKQKCL